MIINFADLNKTQTYAVMTHSIIPRPVAWVLSRNENATLNLAPYSYFQMIGNQPATMMISIGNRPDGPKKDTALNIEREQDFVIHVANIQLAEAVNLSAKSLPPDESEVDLCGLATEEVEGWPLPRVKEAPIAFHCHLSAMHAIAGMHVAYGEVKSAYFNDAILKPAPVEGAPDVPDPTKLDPLARLGGLSYAPLGEVFDLQRPG